MLVGLLSEKGHCKGQVQALKKAGFKVEVLGGGATTFPDRLDALAVRVPSISHGAFDAAKAWKKRTGKPVTFQDGASRMREELMDAVRKQVRHGMKYIWQETGWLVTPFLHKTQKRKEFYPAPSWSDEVRAVARRVWDLSHIVRPRPGALKIVSEEKIVLDMDWLSNHMGILPAGRDTVWGRRPPLLMYDPNRPRARKKAEESVLKALLHWGLIQAYGAPILPPPPVVPDVASTPVGVVSTPAEPPTIPPLEAPVADAVTPLPAPSKKQEQKDDIKAALRLLLEAMINHNYEWVNLHASGEVTFERRIVEHGMLDLSEDS